MAAGLDALVWAPQARRDLIDIWKHYAQAASPDIADDVLRNIGVAAERLKEWPNSGRPRDNIVMGLRSLLAHPYSIFYRFVDQTVEIVRVLHQRRDLVAAFSDNRKP